MDKMSATTPATTPPASELPRTYIVDVRVHGRKVDFSGNPLGNELYECTYGVLRSKRMVKRATGSILPVKYEHLRTLRNPTVIAVHDFVIGDGGNGYLVFETVNGSFKEWVHGSEQAQLFITTSVGKVRLSPMLRTMCIEVARLVDELVARNCYPVNLTIDDLYIKNKIEGGRPAVKVLLDFNVQPVTSSADVDRACAAVRGIIDYCCKIHGVDLDGSSLGFRNYFGLHKSVHQLELYPDAWTDEDKKNYILMISHEDIHDMSTAIIQATVDWPWVPNDPTKAVPVIQDIYDHHMTLSPPVYYTDEAWGYIQLCRNVLKSFAIPTNWQNLVPDTSAFLRIMERNKPSIWKLLYEKIGPLGGGVLKF